MSPATRNRLIIGAAVLLVGGFIAFKMFYSLTPPTHADHDHAMASLDAGGFLWLDAFEGGRRNMVGRPEKVLVLHWFDPGAADSTEQVEAARFSASVAGDPGVELLFVAQAPSWDGVKKRARECGVPIDRLYLDKGGRTGDLFGIRRLPETVIYDPGGRLAFQAKGSMDWAGHEMAMQIERAKAGVEEVQ